MSGIIVTSLETLRVLHQSDFNRVSHFDSKLLNYLVANRPLCDSCPQFFVFDNGFDLIIMARHPVLPVYLPWREKLGEETLIISLKPE